MSEIPKKPCALVTGSSSGIGKAIAIRLAHDGFHVLVHYNSDEAGAVDTLARIQADGGSGEILQFDVKNSEFIDAFTKERDLDVLVNNAGIAADGLAGLMSDDMFDRVIRTNVYGPFYLMRGCVRKMLRRRSGCIVNVASLAGQTGNAGQLNYSASKAALIAMTKSLSQEVGSRGIRVNAVAPGLIQTDMIEGIPFVDEIKKRIPLGRIGTPEEVAGAVAFLCSKDATYITGHTLSVNGGLFPT